MAAQTGTAVYRLDAVTTLHQAGEKPGTHRYRLTCTWLDPSEVPPDVEIHPWRWGGIVPRQTAPQVASKPWLASSVSKPTVRHSRTVAHEAAGDLGPGIRRRAMRDHRGRFLRDPDVEVEDQAADPRHPNRHVRRARRVDTIDLLRRDGTIGSREVEAAGDLRQYLAGTAPSVSGSGLTQVRIAPYLCQPITGSHLQAATELREAAAALGARLWKPVLWVCLGGSVRGYAAQWRVGTHRATALVSDGLKRLGDHLYGVGSHGSDFLHGDHHKSSL